MSWIITPSFTQWTPVLISTALWLDAADANTITLSGGSRVSQWRDKSGNNNHLSQATTDLQPEYQAIGGANGGPTISFANSYIFGDITSPTPLRSMSAIDVIMVCESSIAALPDTNNMSFWGYTRNTGTPWYWWGSTTGALAGETLVFFYSVGADTNPRIGSTSYSRPANTLQIFNTRNSTLGTSVFSNGSPVNLDLSNVISTSTNTAPASISLASDSFTVGGTGEPDNVGSNTGKICEVVVSDSLFSNDNRQRIEGYLAHKWGLTANLPSNHPYKVNPPAP